MTDTETDKKLTFDDLADRNWIVSLSVEKQGQRFSGSLTEVLERVQRVEAAAEAHGKRVQLGDLGRHHAEIDRLLKKLWRLLEREREVRGRYQALMGKPLAERGQGATLRLLQEKTEILRRCVDTMNQINAIPVEACRSHEGLYTSASASSRGRLPSSKAAASAATTLRAWIALQNQAAGCPSEVKNTRSHKRGGRRISVGGWRRNRLP